MPAALYRVDVVLSFDEPVSLGQLRELRRAVTLPEPHLASGADDPAAEEVRLDEDGEGADLTVVVQADSPDAAREQVESDVREALRGSSWGAGHARVDLTRAAGAYEL